MMTPSRRRRSMAASTLSKTPSPRRASVRSFIPSMDRAGLTLPSRPIRFATASSISVPFVYITKKQSGKRWARSRTERPPSRQASGSPPLITKTRVPHVSCASRTVRSKVSQSELLPVGPRVRVAADATQVAGLAGADHEKVARGLAVGGRGSGPWRSLPRGGRRPRCRGSAASPAAPARRAGPWRDPARRRRAWRGRVRPCPARQRPGGAAPRRGGRPGPGSAPPCDGRWRGAPDQCGRGASSAR